MAKCLCLKCVWLIKASVYCVWLSKASESTVSDSAMHLSILRLTHQGISDYGAWLRKASQSTVSDSARHHSLVCLTLQDLHLYWAWLFKVSKHSVLKTEKNYCSLILNPFTLAWITLEQEDDLSSYLSVRESPLHLICAFSQLLHIICINLNFCSFSEIY